MGLHLYHSHANTRLNLRSNSAFPLMYRISFKEGIFSHGCDCKVLGFYNKDTFIYRRKLTHDDVCWEIVYIGSPDDAKKYIYEIKFTKNEVTIAGTEVCASIFEEVTWQNCISFSMSMLKKVTNKSSLNVSITITDKNTKKPKEPRVQAALNFAFMKSK